MKERKELENAPKFTSVNWSHRECYEHFEISHRQIKIYYNIHFKPKNNRRSFVFHRCHFDIRTYRPRHRQPQSVRIHFLNEWNFCFYKFEKRDWMRSFLRCCWKYDSNCSQSTNVTFAIYVILFDNRNLVWCVFVAIVSIICLPCRFTIRLLFIQIQISYDYECQLFDFWLANTTNIVGCQANRWRDKYSHKY